MVKILNEKGDSDFAWKNHTHSYAGSSSVGGSANSAITSNPLGKKAWFHIINMGWDTRTTNSAGLWTSQLAFGTEAGSGMYYRTTNSGAQISTIGWARVLDSSCYKSYCPPISHASSAVTYGKSTSANYGHTTLTLLPIKITLAIL